MAKEISQRELRNESGRIMRSLSDGETFVITSNGEPVGELTPLRRRRFVGAASVVEIFHSAPPIDADRFRRDLDDLADQDVEPRA
jgi:prevent-host-death family protein